MHESEAL